MKLKDILGAQSALSTLNQTRGLSSVTAYRVAKNIKAIESELEVYEEHRKKSLEELADKSEDGSPIIKGNEYQLTEENKKELSNRLNSLMNEDCTVDLKKVTLEDINAAGLSPAEIAALEFMIDLKDGE